MCQEVFMNPKDHQGANSNVITLASLYYKLEFRLIHHQHTEWFGEVAPNPH